MATLDQVIGEEIRRRREEKGVRQEALAQAARAYGLEWNRGTVTAVELGRRGLSLGELALLPLILSEAEIAHPLLAPWLLVPDRDGEVNVSPGLQLPYQLVRDLLGEEWKNGGRWSGTPIAPSQPADRAARLARDAAGAAESKAAGTLRVPAERVAEAALKLWGRSLTAERDVRVEALLDGQEASARRVQAIRGHVTRVLLEELGPLLKRRRAKRTARRR